MFFFLIFLSGNYYDQFFIVYTSAWQVYIIYLPIYNLIFGVFNDLEKSLAKLAEIRNLKFYVDIKFAYKKYERNGLLIGQQNT